MQQYEDHNRILAIERLLVRQGTLSEVAVRGELAKMRTERKEMQQQFWDRLEVGSEIQVSSELPKSRYFYAMQGIVISKSAVACGAITFKVTQRIEGRKYKVGGIYCETALNPTYVRLASLRTSRISGYEICPSVD